MSSIKVKSTKWYRWFWLPERRRVKIMQKIIDYKEKEIFEAIEKSYIDLAIYGFTEQEANKLREEDIC